MMPEQQISSAGFPNSSFSLQRCGKSEILLNWLREYTNDCEKVRKELVFGVIGLYYCQSRELGRYEN